MNDYKEIALPYYFDDNFFYAVDEGAGKYYTFSKKDRKNYGVRKVGEIAACQPFKITEEFRVFNFECGFR